MISELFNDVFWQELKVKGYKRGMYPPASDREFWEECSLGDFKQNSKKLILERADSLIDAPIPETRLRDYTRFQQDGDRAAFESKYFLKRSELGNLVLAYAFSYDKKYFSAIIDRIWSILEESFWCVPAHNIYAANDPVPEMEGDSRVDLFAAVTARLLAECYTIMGEELDDFSPNLTRTLREKTLARTVYPVMSGANPPGWLSGHANWTVWCSRNMVVAGMVFLDHEKEFFRLLGRLNPAVDNFIAHTPEDGFCDEGPSYWVVAAGAMFMYLECLEELFPTLMTPIFENTKIRNMADYYRKMILCGQYVFNHADAPAQTFPPVGLIYRIGERCQNPALQRAVVDIVTDVNYPRTTRDYTCGSVLTLGLMDFCCIPKNWPSFADVKSEPVTYIQSGEVAILRRNKCVGTIKGGHNGEAHNHNDLGHVSLYFDGVPVVIDLGVERYVKQTFSAERYTITHIRGAGHNAPVINGIEQQEGCGYKANVLAIDSHNRQVKLDLSKAYPEELKVGNILRTWTLTESGAELEDIFEESVNGEYHLFSPNKIEQISVTELNILTSKGIVTLKLASGVIKSVETKEPKDDLMIMNWGKLMSEIVIETSSITNKIMFTINK